MAKSAIASVRFIGDASSAVKAAGEVESKIGRMSSSVAKAAGAAALAVGAAVGALGVKAVSMAADLEQSAGAVEAVFKGGSEQMKKFSDQAGTTVGLTKNEYNELATILGSQLKNGGTSIDELGTKTNDLIKTGSDLSAMFGGSTSEAVSALSSALKGERDPIERYGVSLNQAKIDAEAAALGFAKVGGALSSEAAQAATLSLIMKQTADAHGAFGRESDTLAHKQQVLRAGLENSVTTIGEGLLPFVSRAAGALVELLPSVEAAATRFRDFALALSEGGLPQWILTARGPFLAFFAALRDGGEDVTSSGFAGWVEGVGLSINRFMTSAGGFAGIWSKITAAAAPFAPVAAGLGASIGAFALKVGPVGTLLARIGPAFSGIGAHIAKLGPALRFVLGPWGLLIAAFTTAMATSEPFRAAIFGLLGTLGGLAVTLATQLGPVLANLAATVLPALSSIFPVIVTAISSLATALVPIIETVATQIIPLVANLAATILPLLATAFSGLVTAVVPLVTTLVESLVPIIVTIVSTVVPAFVAILGEILPVIPPIVSIILSLVNVLVSLLVPAIEFLLPIVTTVFQGVVKLIQAAVNIIMGVVKVFVGLLTGDWQKLWDGIKQIFSGIWDGIVAVFGTIGKVLGDLAKSGMATVGKWFKDGTDAIGKFFSDMWTSIGKFFTDGLVKVGNFAMSIPSKIGEFLTSNSLFSIGSNLIQGLINGVGSMGSALWNKVSSLASNAVNSLKSALGIASPSRVARGIGVFFGEGLILGVQGQSGKVAAAMRDLATVPAVDVPAVEIEATARLVSLRGAASPAPEATAPPVIVNVSFDGIVGDPIAVAEQIRSVLATYSRVKETAAL